MKPMFKSPVVAVLFSLVSLAVVQAPLSIESRAESDTSTDSRLRLAGKHRTAASAGRPADATELGYYMAPKAAGERPDKAFGGGNSKPDRGRSDGDGANSGDRGRGGGNDGAGNADAGNTGGGNSGGRNSSDRNARDGNSGDGDAGGGTSGDRNGGGGGSDGRSGGTGRGRE